jgi:hypothetical protein
MNTHPQLNTPSLPEKLLEAQEEAELWASLASDASLSQPARAQARENARSFKAAVGLYEKALAYQKQCREAMHRVSVPPKG